jgi:hypothetical protein
MVESKVKYVHQHIRNRKSKPPTNKNCTACGDRTRDQSIKSRTLYLTELRRPLKGHTSEAGFETETFCLGGRRAIYCATRTGLAMHATVFVMKKNKVKSLWWEENKVHHNLATQGKKQKKPKSSNTKKSDTSVGSQTPLEKCLISKAHDLHVEATAEKGMDGE